MNKRKFLSLLGLSPLATWLINAKQKSLWRDKVTEGIMDSRVSKSDYSKYWAMVINFSPLVAESKIMYDTTYKYTDFERHYPERKNFCGASLIFFKDKKEYALVFNSNLNDILYQQCKGRCLPGCSPNILELNINQTDEINRWFATELNYTKQDWEKEWDRVPEQEDFKNFYLRYSDRSFSDRIFFANSFKPI